MRHKPRTTVWHSWSSRAKTTQNDRAAFEIAQSTLVAAKNSRDVALTALRAAAVAGLSQAKQETLTTVRGPTWPREPRSSTSRPTARMRTG